jgi:Holliday junction resolvase
MAQLRPSPPKKSNRRLYEKGWYYEQAAKKIIYKKLFDAGLKAFIIKAPYGYPFDLVAFIPTNYIYFWEIRFTNKNTVYVPKRKIEKTKQIIKGYNGFIFKYFVLAFFGGKYNYKIFEIDLQKKVQDYIFKK